MRFWRVSWSQLQIAYLVDVGQNTTASDGGTDEQVELLVATDRELQVARRDTLHSQILGGVAWMD